MVMWAERIIKGAAASCHGFMATRAAIGAITAFGKIPESENEPNQSLMAKVPQAAAKKQMIMFLIIDFGVVLVI
jgi:hypothetical protein